MNLEQRIKNHNHKIHRAFQYAKRGGIINLSALMISKEQLQRDIDQVKELSKKT
jgi:hypothetical protein